MYSNFICLHQNVAYSRRRHARCAFTKIMFIYICNLSLNHDYHIRTEMYTLTSYVVNFQTQMSSRKSEDDVFYTRKKWHGQSESRSRFFHKWKKGTSNQKPLRCVSFAPISNWPFFSNSFIFIWTLRTKVNMTCNSWITLHPHKRFYWFTLFSLSFRDELWQILAF